MLPEDLLGKSDFLLYPHYMAEKYRFDDVDVIENGNFIDCQDIYLSAGREYWVHTTKVPLYKGAGDIQGVLGLVLMARQLACANTSHDGYWMMDEEGYIFGWDKTACSIMGVSNRDIFGKNISEIGVKKSREIIQNRIKEIGDAGGGYFETVFQAAGKAEKKIAITAVYWEEQKKILGYVNSISDKKNITRQMEQIREDLDLLKSITAQLEVMYTNVGRGKSGYSLEMSLKTILPLMNQIKKISPPKQQKIIRSLWDRLLTI